MYWVTAVANVHTSGWFYMFKAVLGFEAAAEVPEEVPEDKSA